MAFGVDDAALILSAIASAYSAYQQGKPKPGATTGASIGDFKPSATGFAPPATPPGNKVVDALGVAPVGSDSGKVAPTPPPMQYSTTGAPRSMAGSPDAPLGGQELPVADLSSTSKPQFGNVLPASATKNLSANSMADAKPIPPAEVQGGGGGFNGDKAAQYASLANMVGGTVAQALQPGPAGPVSGGRMIGYDPTVPDARQRLAMMMRSIYGRG